MGQKSLIYSFVARGTVILAEYTEFKGNFQAVASQCLQKLPANQNRFNYNCDGYTFSYLIDNGYSLCNTNDLPIRREVLIEMILKKM
ncbi:synaptobrevin, Longin-like domain protein [Artemisia annua]|uniref:Synaptobrevin, Longin-like domain protein n=1 Tax=Artemisia annua TaxID=35608 RepID=A0A2U1PMP8_ARTAN|nr:synaptobrevin, Longin-like domain protein [Artemisia annua]